MIDADSGTKQFDQIWKDARVIDEIGRSLAPRAALDTVIDRVVAPRIFEPVVHERIESRKLAFAEHILDNQVAFEVKEELLSFVHVSNPLSANYCNCHNDNMG